MRILAYTLALVFHHVTGAGKGQPADQPTYYIVNAHSKRRLFFSGMDSEHGEWTETIGAKYDAKYERSGVPSQSDTGPCGRHAWYLDHFATRNGRENPCKTYYIRNAETGWRLFARWCAWDCFTWHRAFGGCPRTFYVNSDIHHGDQEWRLELQSDGTYVITNDLSDRHLYAQAGLGSIQDGWKNGVGAGRYGTQIYEDNKWLIVSTVDGSSFRDRPGPNGLFEEPPRHATPARVETTTRAEEVRPRSAALDTTVHELKEDRQAADSDLDDKRINVSQLFDIDRLEGQISTYEAEIRAMRAVVADIRNATSQKHVADVSVYMHQALVRVDRIDANSKLLRGTIADFYLHR